MNREVFRTNVRGLCELGKDCAKGKALTCSILSVKNRKIAGDRERKIEMGEWVEWKGKTFNKIYTDGSWKKVNTVASLLLDKGKVKAGGGIVLTDGNWFSPIAVEMDMETESAFDPETISLLAAYEFARRAGHKVEINTGHHA